MRIFVRCIGDYRSLWRVWFPLLLLGAMVPLVAVAVPLVEKRLIDSVVLAHRLTLLAGIAALYAGLMIARSVILVIGAALRSYLSERMSLLLRFRLFKQCTRLSLEYTRRENSGRTVGLFVNDVPSLTNLFSVTIVDGVSAVVVLVIGAAVMASLNLQLAVVAFVAPLVLAFVAAAVTRPLRPLSRRAQEIAGDVVSLVHEHLSGMREVVAFGQSERQHLDFLGTLRDLLRTKMRVVYLNTGIQSGSGLLSVAVTMIILFYGAYLVIENKTTLGSVIAMRSLFNLLSQPAGDIVGMLGNAQQALGAGDRVYGFLDEEPLVQEMPNAIELARSDGEVVFDHVFFDYVPGQPVLRDVSLTVRPGEVVALVGPSGVGKTTVTSLLARFYDPSEGRVLLDGVDIRGVTLESLHQHIAVVFQDTFLFDTTVYENIELGREDASEEQIIAAAQAANAWEFIQQLPDGLDTAVGERGMKLSEGQKQRIAIARALLRAPSILILDEPTSSLDARSEHSIQNALETLMRGRTTFVIAHRLATVRRANRIVVLDDGRVVEQGTHGELLALGGVYRELVELQFGNWDELDEDGALDQEYVEDLASSSVNRDNHVDPTLSLAHLP